MKTSFNTRAIVNVSTGDFYQSQQANMIDSFNPLILSSLFNIEILTWKDFPDGSKTHDQSPYGFKLHAIKKAYELHYATVLWLDSPAHCVAADITPIFEKIEQHGYYAMSHHDPLENWVGDTALKRFGMTRDQLKGFHLPSGSCYGFDLSSQWVRDMFNEICQCEEDGLFKSEVIGPDKWHRHDEAILALVLIKWGMPVFFNDPLFQSDSPECVIRSGANWTQDAKVYGG